MTDPSNASGPELPIDLKRWTLAFEELCAVVLEVAHGHTPASEDTWSWIRMHYAMSMATYSMMTADQQSQVVGPLEALRARLEQLSH